MLPILDEFSRRSFAIEVKRHLTSLDIPSTPQPSQGE